MKYERKSRKKNNENFSQVLKRKFLWVGTNKKPFLFITKYFFQIKHSERFMNVNTTSNKESFIEIIQTFPFRKIKRIKRETNFTKPHIGTKDARVGIANERKCLLFFCNNVLFEHARKVQEYIWQIQRGIKKHLTSKRYKGYWF